MSMKCPVCGEYFDRVGRRVFCSNACKQRAYRRVGVRLPWKRRPTDPAASKTDCVPSSISFATGKSFIAIKEWLDNVRKGKGQGRFRNGYNFKTFAVILEALGFAKMDGYKRTLLHTECGLSDGLYIVFTRSHMFVVLDGVIHDSWNSQKKYLKALRGVYRAPVGYAIELRKRLGRQ